MIFGFILSIDIPFEEFQPTQAKMADFNPRAVIKRRGCVRKTESGIEDIGCGVDCRHQKWVGLITKNEMAALADYLNLEATTMLEAGALGMPGVEPWFGSAPAWSFDAPSSAMVNICITPWPSIAKKTGVADRDVTWKRLKRATRSFIEEASCGRYVPKKSS